MVNFSQISSNFIINYTIYMVFPQDNKKEKYKRMRRIRRSICINSVYDKYIHK